MNIALVTSEFVTESNFDGGLANYNHRLAKSLIEYGHKPVIFVSADKDEKIIFDGIEVQRVKIRDYDAWIWKNKILSKPYSILRRILYKYNSVFRKFYKQKHFDYWNNWFTLKQQSKDLNASILEVHKKTPFDIIHYAHLGGVGYHRPDNIPSVARISSSTALCQQYGGYGTTDDAIKAQEKIEFKALKRMSGVFGPSRMIAGITEKIIKRHIEIIETPFIEETTANDASLYNEKLEGKKYILFFGTISLIKGVGTIAEIIYDVLKNNPQYYFVFVGKSLHSPNPAISMIEHVRKKAAEFSDRVIHLSKTPHAQLYPIIEKADFVALPSCVDNFPNTCIEAMAHSKIVIGTLGNGFEQLIADGKSGFLVPTDNPPQLLAAITKVIGLNEQNKKAVEKLALKRTEELKPGKVVVQLIDFYTKHIK